MKNPWILYITVRVGIFAAILAIMLAVGFDPFFAALIAAVVSLAISLIFGISVSTVLTLVVIPTLYYAAYRKRTDVLMPPQASV